MKRPVDASSVSLPIRPEAVGQGAWGKQPDLGKSARACLGGRACRACQGAGRRGQICRVTNLPRPRPIGSAGGDPTFTASFTRLHVQWPGMRPDTARPAGDGNALAPQVVDPERSVAAAYGAVAGGGAAGIAVEPPREGAAVAGSGEDGGLKEPMTLLKGHKPQQATGRIGACSSHSQSADLCALRSPIECCPQGQSEQSGNL